MLSGKFHGFFLDCHETLKYILQSEAEFLTLQLVIYIYIYIYIYICIVNTVLQKVKQNCKFGMVDIFRCLVYWQTYWCWTFLKHNCRNFVPSVAHMRVTKIEERLCDFVKAGKFSRCCRYLKLQLQGGSNMTGTDLCVNKPHCAAAVRPWESEATTSTLPPARVRTFSVLSGSC